MNNFQSLRGMKDILPSEIYKWNYLESVLKNILIKYNYKEIRLPLIENSELFHRTIGNSTDIIEKETYTFTDRNGEKITLRPEGTASCLRAVIQHNMLKTNNYLKLWYYGPMFRYERPQKGRYRQFVQLGVEYYGGQYNYIQDAEVILLTWKFWKTLFLEKNVILKINNIGTIENRLKYTEHLIQYLNKFKNELDIDSQQRMIKNNVLRILDSKNPKTKEILINAPKLLNFIDEQYKKEFYLLINFLKINNIPYIINSNLIRGLDYYSYTVFEWETINLDDYNNSICAGGRYNNMISSENNLSKTYSSVGFAIGIERIIELLTQLNLFPNIKNNPDIYIISDHQSLFRAMSIVETLRNLYPMIIIEFNAAIIGNFKNQFKKAHKSLAKIAIILASNELQNDACSIKYLRKKENQISITISDLQKDLIDILNKQ